MKKITMKEISTTPTKGEMPWDNLWDCSLYTKTQVKVETTIYKVEEILPSYPTLRDGEV